MKNKNKITTLSEQLQNTTLSEQLQNTTLSEQTKNTTLSEHNFHIILFSDTDGDLVTFSSDEEFREAFTSIVNGILKIFVSGKYKYSIKKHSV